MSNMRIGTDPELFVLHEGQPKSAQGLVGGVKGAPEMLTEYGGALLDNVMLEFNVAASKKPAVLTERLWELRETLEDRISAFGATLSATPVLNFEKGELVKNGMEMGCAMDYIATPNKAQPRQPASVDTFGTQRFAGGHIHLEMSADCKVTQHEAVMLADAFIGLWLTTQYDFNDRDTFYGQPSVFRPTPYGIEYRTPSNEWFASRESTLAAFEQAELASRIINDKNAKDILDKTPVADIIHANSIKQKSAASVLLKYMFSII